MKEGRLLPVGGCIDWVPRLYLTLKCQGIRAQRFGVAVLRGYDDLTCWVLPNVDTERQAGGFSFLSSKILRRRVVGSEKHKLDVEVSCCTDSGSRGPTWRACSELYFFILDFDDTWSPKRPTQPINLGNSTLSPLWTAQEKYSFKKPIMNTENVCVNVFVGTYNADISNFVQNYVFLLWLYLHFWVWNVLFCSLIMAFKHLKMQHYSHAQMFPFFCYMSAYLASCLWIFATKKKKTKQKNSGFQLPTYARLELQIIWDWSGRGHTVTWD